MSRTQGRWQATKSKHGIEPDHHVIAVLDPDAGDRSILIHAAGEAGDPHADSERIVACVNACAAFEDDEMQYLSLVGPFGHGVIAALRSQRDELLAALKQIIGACDECAKGDSISIVDTFTQQMEDDARALILDIEAKS